MIDRLDLSCDVLTLRMRVSQLRELATKMGLEAGLARSRDGLGVVQDSVPCQQLNIMSSQGEVPVPRLSQHENVTGKCPDPMDAGMIQDCDKVEMGAY